MDLVVATLPDLTSMISKTYVNEIDINKIKPDPNQPRTIIDEEKIEDMAKDIITFKQMFMANNSNFYYWPEGKTDSVSPEDYNGRFTFKSFAGFKMVREIERKQLIEAMTFIFGNQAFLPIVMPKANEWLERLIDYFDLRSPEQLYVTDQEQAQMQTMQMIQGMMTGQNPLMPGGEGGGQPQIPSLGEKSMRMPEQSPNQMTMQMMGR